MKLFTKINICLGIILIILMVSVFIFTQRFFEKELEAQMENSLRVTFESFKITIDNIIKEQTLRSLTQTKRDIIAIATKDRITSVLNYYLNLAATDYNVNLIEVLDRDRILLADNNRPYDGNSILNINIPEGSGSESYFSRRGDQMYLMTTTPIFSAGELVGYLNLGTLVDQNLITYFSSVLHSKLVFFADGRFLAGSINQASLPEQNYYTVKPPEVLFVSGRAAGVDKYDFIFFNVPSDGQFSATVGIARSRSEELAALFRLTVFLFTLTGLGLLFGFIGAMALAQNIKKSIFGMEPNEIASLLDQHTTILQSTFEGIIALDKAGLITLINKEAQRFFPANSDITGQPVASFFPGLKIKELLTSGQAVYNQQQVTGENVIVYNCVPIKTRNTILGAVITLRDLTEFQKVAEELVEVKNYTQALRSQSHEFMNKMQSVSGLIQLGRYETALALLHETTESHQDMISYLSNAFSTSAVSGILLGKFNRAKELNIQFELVRTSFIPKNIKFPDHELVCIVGNLIENAFESLQESKQSLKKVKVKICPVGRFLKITIADNGPGIPGSIKKKIFERGFTSKKGLNKGVGLSLVRQCVDNLRGTIRFHSGSQTVFSVKIPIKNGGCLLE